MKRKDSKKRAPSSPSQSETAIKGTVLEQVVAMLHSYEGVKVETRVKLPAIRGNTKRKREIDVLLSSKVADYPVRIAISCRNEATKVEVEDIGAFADLLKDVGIPTQHGIFVSINGFRKGALERAKELGIRTFVLRGLTEDRLAVEVQKAFQYFVYLLPEVIETHVRTEIPEPHLALVFSDEKENFCGDVVDLVVSRWRQREIPARLGELDLDLEIPEGWYQFHKHKPVNVHFAKVKMRILAYVIELVGETKQFGLFDAEKGKREKFRLQTDFNIAEAAKKQFAVRTATTETELKALLQEPGIRIVQRFRLPRVLAGACFHPMSERVMKMVHRETNGLSLNDVERLPPLTVDEVEGPVHGSIHERPARWFPVIVRNAQGTLVDVQLLMRNAEYNRIVALAPLLDKYPTPEFAQLISVARRRLAAVITGAASA